MYYLTKKYLRVLLKIISKIILKEIKIKSNL